MNKYLILLTSLILSSSPLAQKAQMKIEDIKADGDTTITVRKGEKALPEKNYEIISGTDEIAGDEEFDSKKALSSWKEACDNWKKEIKELNSENRILVISCGAKKKSTDGTKTSYSSNAHYKIRVKMRD